MIPMLAAAIGRRPRGLGRPTWTHSYMYGNAGKSLGPLGARRWRPGGGHADEAMSIGDRYALAVPIRPHRTSMMLVIAVVDVMTTVGWLEAGGRGIVKTGAFDI